MADLDNRMVLLTSVTAGRDQDELDTAGLLVGELAINTNDGILFAGADPNGTGDGTTAKSAGQPVHDAADVLGIKLSTASTAQAVGTGNSPAFAGATINDGNLTINNGTASAANQGGKLILAADDGAVMADNHRLGVIEFKGAEDTSNTLSIGARIEAIARSAWAGSDNDADLVFYTTDGTTETAALTLDADSKATFGGAVDINSGNIDGATIATSDVTVGSGKTLDVSGGTLTLANDQISGNAITGGTIGATTISTLTTAAINASADLDIGAYSLRATQFTSDIADGTAPFVVTSTTKVANLNADTLDGVSSAGFVAVGGDAMTGNLAMGANSITGVADPSGAQDAATKAYVDATAQGLYIQEPVVMATTASLGYTYSNGTLGVGATFTASGNGAVTIDGIATATTGERVLVKNEDDAEENGIYQVSTASGASATLVLTRVTDFDAAADIKSGSFVFVQKGTANADSGFVMTQDDAITVGSTEITWSQFSGAGQITAGSGLTKSGNEIDLTDISDDHILANTSGSSAAPSGVSAPMIGVITAANAGAARTVLGAGTGSGTMSDVVDDTTPQLGGDLIPGTNYIGMTKGTDLASATALLLDGSSSTGGLTGDYFDVTGTTTITSMTVAANRHFFLQFDGALQLTHHATNLDLPGAANITTVAGDVAEFFSTGANTVQCVNYTRAAGIKNADIGSSAGIATSKLADATQIDRLALGGILTTAGAITHSGAHAVTLTTTGTTAITLPTSGTLVGTTAAQTLTNKTLTTPIISSLYVDDSSSTMTFPNVSSDTVCVLAATQTLENKTISGGTF